MNTDVLLGLPLKKTSHPCVSKRSQGRFREDRVVLERRTVAIRLPHSMAARKLVEGNSLASVVGCQ